MSGENAASNVIGEDQFKDYEPTAAEQAEIDRKASGKKAPGFNAHTGNTGNRPVKLQICSEAYEAVHLHRDRMKNGAEDIRRITIQAGVDKSTGKPGIWEAGGRDRTTVAAVLSAGPNGQRQQALVGFRRGKFQNSRHILLPAIQGNLVAYIGGEAGVMTLAVYTIKGFETQPCVRGDEERDEVFIKLELLEVYDGMAVIDGVLTDKNRIWTNPDNLDDELASSPEYVEFLKAVQDKSNYMFCTTAIYGIPWRKVTLKKGDGWKPSEDMPTEQRQKILEAGTQPMIPAEVIGDGISWTDWLVRLSDQVGELLAKKANGDGVTRANLVMTVNRECRHNKDLPENLLRLTVQLVTTSGVRNPGLIKTYCTTFILDENHDSARPTWADGSSITSGLFKVLDKNTETGTYRLVFEYSGT